MNKVTFSTLLLLTLLVVNEPSGYAQASDDSRRSDQVMNQLLNEVRQLRQDLRKLASNSYRSQALIERLKLQQDQIHRITSELAAVRSDLAAVKSGKAQIKEKLSLTQERVDSGAAPSADLNSLKAMIAELEQREPELIVKESQLNGQLNIERSTLEELYKKLDAIDTELQSLTNDEKRQKEKP